ncbi:MAG TPA: tetratricopeptide repeat protein, partial [Candidatus Melainabacteria bacterium]|nr:tetratricopeptide repeat protein [Candidatus Melainabacteria bacterium]
NNLKGALEFYNKALEKEPGLKQAYAGKAFTEMRSGDYDNAIVDATSAIDKDESEIPVYYARMMSYSALGEYEKALSDCKKLIDMGGMSKADYLVDRARLYRNKGDTEEALAELDRIIDRKPDLIRALATRAYMLYQSGNRDAALSDLVRIYSVKEPATEYEFLNRAYASLIFDRNREVLRDVFALFEEYPDEKEPLTYAGILGSLAAKEVKNDKDMQVIRARLEKTASIEFWPFPIAAYVFGDIDESKLLAMADDNVSRLTEARAFIGYLNEIEGDRERALSNYRWVVEKGNKFFMEYDLAQVRLKMLEHPQPSN